MMDDYFEQRCWINWLVRTIQQDKNIYFSCARISLASHRYKQWLSQRRWQWGCAKVARRERHSIQRFGRKICGTTEAFIHSIYAYSFGCLLYEGSNKRDHANNGYAKCPSVQPMSLPLCSQFHHNGLSQAMFLCSLMRGIKLIFVGKVYLRHISGILIA